MAPHVSVLSKLETMFCMPRLELELKITRGQILSWTCRSRAAAFAPQQNVEQETNVETRDLRCACGPIAYEVGFQTLYIVVMDIGKAYMSTNPRGGQQGDLANFDQKMVHSTDSRKRLRLALFNFV